VPEPKVPTNYFRVRACSPNVEQEEVTFRPFPLLAPIHPSAWKKDSANFAFYKFSEISEIRREIEVG
jgi:hypothetical protein